MQKNSIIFLIFSLFFINQLTAQTMNRNISRTQKDGIIETEIVFDSIYQDKITIINHADRDPIIYDGNKTKLALPMSFMSDKLIYKSDTIKLDKLFFEDYSADFGLKSTKYFMFGEKRYLIVLFKDELSSSYIDIYTVVLEINENNYYLYHFITDDYEDSTFHYLADKQALTCELVRESLGKKRVLELKDGKLVETTIK